MRSFSLTRTVQVLALLALSLLLLYVGRLFLVPLVFAAILAMLLVPVARRLEQWGNGRVVSGLLCVVLVLAVLGGIGWAIGAQAANISEQLPQIQQKLQVLLQQVQHWIQQRFGVAPREQIQFAEEHVAKFSQSANRYLTSSLKGLAGVLGGLVLVLLYLFFMLWGRHKFREFFLRLAVPEQREEMSRMLHEITQVSAQYLSGRLLSVLFLTAVYAVGFLLVGLKNALLLALIAALPTLVPYVGAYVGALFPLAMATVGGSTGQLLPTVGIILVAQFIDNNVIEPLVMGSQLNLSPIFTIIAVVLGELLWGIPGMMLFEPLAAILRIVCSHVPALHPYAYLLADETETPQWIKRLKQKGKKLL